MGGLFGSSKKDSSSSGKDKGKGKERSQTHDTHDSKGRSVTAASSSGKGKRSNSYSTGQWDQLSRSVPNDVEYYGGQFPEGAGQERYAAGALDVHGYEAEDNNRSLDRDPALYSASTPGRNISDAVYQPCGNLGEQKPYEYDSMGRTDYTDEDISGLPTTLATASISFQPTPSTYVYLRPNTLAGSTPSAFNNGNDSGVGSLGQRDDGQKTPRKNGNFTGGSGGAGGSGGRGNGRGNRRGGEKASRVDTVDRQRQGNKENWEPLDAADYKLHKSYDFVPGRVLKIFWFEPSGTNGRDNEATSVGKDTLSGSNMPGKVRRFIIIETRKGHSTAIPISTYGGRGCFKNGCHPEDHSMVYTGYKKNYFGGEKVPHPPIEMLPMAAEELLPASRVNYAKKHTIEHNFRVKFIGEISTESSGAFWKTYNAVNSTWETPGKPSKPRKPRK